MASCKYDSIAKQFQGIFTNETIKELPIDSCTVNTPRTVPSACFTEVEPTPLSQPVLVAASTSALALIDLDLGAEDADELAAWFSGNVTITGAHPHAHCYAGHQYGYFNGQLGDGANLYYGDITNRLGEKWQLQLKGTGPTPYSRAGTDGRKVLRSSIREFLCSEAMYHLGVPTTRAATCVVGSDTVTRDKNYDGKLKPERAAVVSRIAPTFLRIGSLEICKLKDAVSKREGPSAGNAALLRSMLDFTIKMYYPEIQAKEASEEMRYISFFEAFVLRTARLVAQWQCLGFGHGVLNTDNISLVGVTLDYGPFSFMGTYDPDHIPNASDHWAIFRYGKQPDQCKWCINKMAEVLTLILPPEKINSAVTSTLFDAEFERHYMKQMRKKLGLKEHRDDDRQLVDELLDTMAKTGADFHKTFRLLSSYPGRSVTEDVLQHCCSADDLRHIYRKREYPTEDELLRSLWGLRSNPDLLPKAVDDIHEAIDGLNSRPILREYQDLTDENKKLVDRRLWDTWFESFKTRLQFEADDICWNDRSVAMNKENPRFILKNYILEEAISSAENGDFQLVQTLLKMCDHPFSENVADDLGATAQSMLSLYDQGKSGQPSGTVT